MVVVIMDVIVIAHNLISQAAMVSAARVACKLSLGGVAGLRKRRAS
jgi:hypothetical protein